MKKQELNKKLAEWAGLHPRERSDGQTIQRIDQPNFDQSLDACFKWLVPRLYQCSIVMMGHNDPMLITYYTSIRMAEGQVFFAEAETPALALCLAIEKLIDKES